MRPAHDRRRAATTGPHGYLIKPFNERELLTAIEVAIRKHEIERHLAERERWFSTTLASLGDAVIGVAGPVTPKLLQGTKALEIARKRSAAIALFRGTQNVAA